MRLRAQKKRSRRSRRRVRVPPLMRLSPGLRRVVASALFVLYTAFAVVSGGLAECHESDGSVRIEWRGAACCVPGVPSAPASEVSASLSTPPGDGGDCDGCEDHSIAQGVTATPVRTGQSESGQAPDLPTPPASPTVCSASPVPSDLVALSARQRCAPLPPPPLAALRTVVLRC